MDVNISKPIDTPGWQAVLQSHLHPQRPHQARLGRGRRPAGKSPGRCLLSRLDRGRSAQTHGRWIGRSDATAAYNSPKKKKSESMRSPVAWSSPIRWVKKTTDYGCARRKRNSSKTSSSHARKTWLGYCLSLSYFTQCCSKTYVEEIERKALCTPKCQGFGTTLRYAPRSSKSRNSLRRSQSTT